MLGKTLGVPLFQEQAMQIAIVAAGFTPGEADQLRRAMATFRHTGTIDSFREKFIAGMVGNGYEREFAERCFSQIEGFGEYGFPESHAASFAQLVYVSAWIKRHYPAAFCAALLNSQPMGFYPPAQLVRDAREHGVEVRQADVNAAMGLHAGASLSSRCGLPAPLRGRDSEGRRDRRRRMEGRFEFPLPFPLTLSPQERTESGGSPAPSVSACASSTAWQESPKPIYRRWHAARATPASRRCGSERRARQRLERLADADAFRSAGLDRRAALWAVKGLDGGTLQAEPNAPPLPTPPDRIGGTAPTCSTRYPSPCRPRSASTWWRTTPLDPPPSRRIPSPSSVRTSPARVLTSAAALGGAGLAGRRVTVAGLVLVRQRPGTAKGTIFLTLEDETGIVNVVVWPKVFERSAAC